MRCWWHEEENEAFSLVHWSQAGIDRTTRHPHLKRLFPDMIGAIVGNSMIWLLHWFGPCASYTRSQFCPPAPLLLYGYTILYSTSFLCFSPLWSSSRKTKVLVFQMSRLWPHASLSTNCCCRAAWGDIQYSIDACVFPPLPILASRWGHCWLG
jgi:hypothetical protein